MLIKLRPALKGKVPTSRAVREKIVAKGIETTHRMDLLFDNAAGVPSFGVDGVTVFGQSHVMITQMKADLVRFLKLYRLGDKSHVADAEAEATVRTIEDACGPSGTDEVGGIMVDNAGVGMARLVREKMKDKKNIVGRDCAHTLDLLAKCLAGSGGPLFVIITEANAMVKFMNRDKVVGIKDVMVAQKQTARFNKPVGFADTRFYGAATTLESIQPGRGFLAKLQTNELFNKYYESRKSADKEAIDEILAQGAKPSWWDQVGFAIDFLGPIREAVGLVCCSWMPMSAYLLIVLTLHKILLAAAKKFTPAKIKKAIIKEMKCRFNTDFKPIANTRKVPFLDDYQGFCFLLDPWLKMMFYHCLPSDVQKHLEKQLIEWAVLREEEGRENGVLKMSLRTELRAYIMGRHPFDQSLSEAKADLKMTFPDLADQPGIPSFQLISNIVQATGGHNARLDFWEVYHGQTNLYKYCARNLMSLQSHGSITVERVAKPLKNAVWTKDRARADPGLACQLLRVGLNLRFLEKRSRDAASDAGLWMFCKSMGAGEM